MALSFSVTMPAYSSLFLNTGKNIDEGDKGTARRGWMLAGRDSDRIRPSCSSGYRASWPAPAVWAAPYANAPDI